ncbi:cytochrome C oxidase Cbb3, partial [Bradyrhizobium sp. 138]|uniref:cbb3-type cytochrome c oxidase N-terminal domain-containing protein n=1 Tax=Bradyrhizobium sp. 138 TaxID=2782615 RepID=UPI0023EE6118
MTDHHSDIDSVSGKSTTGHEWDGIKELNTPLPRWWVICFYLTIVWAVAYWIVYPAWPLVSSNTTGMFGYSSRADVAVELA